MITVTVYPRRNLLGRKRWGIRIQAANGEKLGHEYNDPDSAVHAAHLIFGTASAQLRVVDANGNTRSRRWLR